MGKTPQTTPDGPNLARLARRLVEAQTTMTLATAEADAAWAAPVYYVFCRSRFYFFSDPDSRHVREALRSGHSAAAIYGPASSWQEIRGIQMSGVIAEVPPGLEAVRAVEAYLKKFSFTREFFGGTETLDLAAFAGRFRVRLYGLSPREVYYLDNAVRFGFRERVVL